MQFSDVIFMGVMMSPVIIAAWGGSYYFAYTSRKDWEKALAVKFADLAPIIEGKVVNNALRGTFAGVPTSVTPCEFNQDLTIAMELGIIQGSQPWEINHSGQPPLKASDELTVGMTEPVSLAAQHLAKHPDLAQGEAYAPVWTYDHAAGTLTYKVYSSSVHVRGYRSDGSANVNVDRRGQFLADRVPLPDPERFLEELTLMSTLGAINQKVNHR